MSSYIKETDWTKWDNRDIIEFLEYEIIRQSNTLEKTRMLLKAIEDLGKIMSFDGRLKLEIKTMAVKTGFSVSLGEGMPIVEISLYE